MEFKSDEEVKQTEAVKEPKVKQIKEPKSKEKLIVKINVTDDGINVENDYPDKVTVIINQ
jgi:hypothetical protein